MYIKRFTIIHQLYINNKKVLLEGLFVFNLFIVDYFHRNLQIAFHKQQDLSQTPSAVNKIAE